MSKRAIIHSSSQLINTPLLPLLIGPSDYWDGGEEEKKGKRLGLEKKLQTFCAWLGIPSSQLLAPRSLI